MMDIMSGDRPILFIDTCALSDKNFISWLSGYTGIKKISVVTYMEYLTYLLDKGRDETYLDKLLRNAKVDIEFFRKDDATNSAHLMSTRPVGSRRCSSCNQVNWNDTIIASQGNRFQAWIITKNVDDFPTDSGYNVKSIESAINELSDCHY